MKLLVIGSGGREHAIIHALKKNKNVEEIYCLPGNGGIAKDAIIYPIKANEIDAQVAFAKEKEIDYVIVTPDNPLALGAVDKFEAAGFKCFGPYQKAAIIESSKAFSKDLMKRYNIPTADYQTFDNEEEAYDYIDLKGAPIVIKADGLALGKGVIIAQTVEEAKEAVKEMLSDKKFGDAGNTIVIEEYLEGPEVSILTFTDGETLKPMISSMDHKRALDNDCGLNTGGMGAIAPNPYYTKEIEEISMKTIFLPTIEAMKKEGRTFKGCLYFSLMLTKDGPKVIEYNARFGDPETQAVLKLMESDLLEAMMATTNGTLKDFDIKFSQDSACCVIVASKGYPLSYQKDFLIEIDDDILDDCDIAGAYLKDNKLYSNGGRVIALTKTAPTLKEAIDASYKALKGIHFENGYYRHDIGQRALKAEVK